MEILLRSGFCLPVLFTGLSLSTPEELFIHLSSFIDSALRAYFGVHELYEAIGVILHMEPVAFTADFVSCLFVCLFYCLTSS